MRGLSSVIIYLAGIFCLTYMLQVPTDMEFTDRKQMDYYSSAFKLAVADTASEVSEFEAQQDVNPLRYNREKEIEITEQTLDIFFINLAHKFNLGNNVDEIHKLMMHSPASVIVGFDGFKIVTLDPEGFTGGGDFKPYIWPERPYTYRLNNGSILYFTLGEYSTLYDPSTNQYFEGTFSELKAIRNLAPLTDDSSFKEARVLAVSKSIERALGAAVNRHNLLSKNLEIKVEFGLPKDFQSITIDNIGFYSFLQGYPLPGGQLLNTYSFSGGNVRVDVLYYGTVDNAGKLVAFNEKCGVPPGYQIIETFRSEKEAASKGYFPQLCLK